MALTKKLKQKHTPAGRRLIGALRQVQALEFARRVREVREKLGLNQAQFAHTFGLSVRSLQEWEQGRVVPSGAARAFLIVIDREPDAVRRALVDFAVSGSHPAEHQPAHP